MHEAQLGLDALQVGSVGHTRSYTQLGQALVIHDGLVLLQSPHGPVAGAELQQLGVNGVPERLQDAFVESSFYHGTWAGKEIKAP